MDVGKKIISLSFIDFQCFSETLYIGVGMSIVFLFFYSKVEVIRSFTKEIDG